MKDKLLLAFVLIVSCAIGVVSTLAYQQQTHKEIVCPVQVKSDGTYEIKLLPKAINSKVINSIEL